MVCIYCALLKLAALALAFHYAYQGVGDRTLSNEVRICEVT